tara:strand:- start:25400 stop:25741 length:342 start_codon:yes stop_codon:yes gene_type:complete
MDPLMHSKSSVKKYGGTVDDYLPIHHWFDDSKRGYAFVTHRAMRHHSEGIGWCIDTFGKYITITHRDKPKQIPVRYVAEQHVLEDCGFIPTMQDWLKHMAPPTWMRKVGKLSK